MRIDAFTLVNSVKPFADGFCGNGMAGLVTGLFRSQA